MSAQTPKDSDLLLQPSTSLGAGNSSPDFSNVQGHADSVAGGSGGGGVSPDFSNVQGHSDTVPGGSGAGGGMGSQTYTVKKGDTLSHIAQHHYGKARNWPAIFEANREQLQTPALIHHRQVLRLPDSH